MRSCLPQEDLEQVIALVLAGLRESTIRWFDEANLTRDDTIHVIELVLRRLDKHWIERKIPLTVIYVAARIIEEVVERFEDENGKDSAKIGTVVIGTMSEDFHSLGKNLVRRTLMPFFHVHDLGVNVDIDRFISCAKEHDADIIAVSALMMNSVLQLQSLRNAIDDTSWKKKPKLIVGGAPFTIDSELHKYTGADAYAPNAIVVAERCMALMDVK